MINKKKIMTELSKKELLEINGGKDGFFDYARSIAIVGGYATGRAFDLALGFYDELTKSK
ncbi:hypothetical protein KUL156_49210 [Alteromonas sp. KUL156]|nr:hypothetical protein KUL154_15650 [Alteromonas sp. KUL154]GFE02329.1 hypothetical protein KUL156_49210 [Alteromonas sp. KUL156]